MGWFGLISPSIGLDYDSPIFGPLMTWADFPCKSTIKICQCQVHLPVKPHMLRVVPFFFNRGSQWFLVLFFLMIPKNRENSLNIFKRYIKANVSHPKKPAGSYARLILYEVLSQGQGLLDRIQFYLQRSGSLVVPQLTQVKHDFKYWNSQGT